MNRKVFRGFVFLVLLFAAEAVAVGSTVQTTTQLKSAIDWSQTVKAVLDAVAPAKKMADDFMASTQSLASTEATTTTTTATNSLSPNSLRSKAISLATDAQSKIDIVNYVWFANFVIAFFSTLAALPAMEMLSIRGAVGWSFWTTLIASCVYVIAMSVEFIALHRFIKRMIVWIANFVLGAVDSADSAASKISERTNLDIFAVAEKLPSSAAGMLLSNHLSVGQNTVRKEGSATNAKAETANLISSGASTSSGSSFSLSSGLIDTLTSVPFESFPVQTENICASAWLSSSTSRLTSNMLVYYNDEGPLSTWSPIARWNMRRLAHQRKIPNPSNCTQASDGSVDSSQCPGYMLWTKGASSYCDCTGILAKLGFDQDMTGMASCVTSARDTVMRLFRSVIAPDAASASQRNADLFASQRQDNCVGTFDVLNADPLGPGDFFVMAYTRKAVGCVLGVTNPARVFANQTVEQCIVWCENMLGCPAFDYYTNTSTCIMQSSSAALKTCGPGMVTYVKPLSRTLMYSSSVYSDAASFSDYYAKIGGTNGLQWTFTGCLTGNLTFDFRYAASPPVNIQPVWNSQNVTLSDGSRLVNNTDKLLMRGNFVVGPLQVTTPGLQTLQILKTVAPDGTLFIHRVKVCTDGTALGCPTGPVDEVYCYRAYDSSTFSTVLTLNYAGTATPSFSAAVSSCNARVDCAGIVTASGGGYTLMGGTRTSGTSRVYQRFNGIADSYMCLN